MSMIKRTRTRTFESPDGSPVSGTTTVSAVRRSAVVAAALVCGAALVGIGSRWGLWYLPFVGGLAIGVLTRVKQMRTRAAAWSGGAIAIGGWGAPLLWRAATGEPVGSTARSVAALAGVPPLAVVIITATLLIALLQAFLGIWLGRSTVRALVTKPM
jgi:hypothetical protein